MIYIRRTEGPGAWQTWPTIHLSNQLLIYCDQFQILFTLSRRGSWRTGTRFPNDVRSRARPTKPYIKQAEHMTKRSVAATASHRDASNPPKDAPRNTYHAIHLTKCILQIHIMEYLSRGLDYEMYFMQDISHNIYICIYIYVYAQCGTYITEYIYI